MTKFLNLTPHTLNLIFVRDGVEEDMVLPSSGVCRVDSTPGAAEDSIGGIAIEGAPVFGDVIGLPDPVEGTFLIVSAMAAEHIKGRTDVFRPGTGPKDNARRDEKNLITGVRKLIRVG
jgi:hypothetical protein